jgi:chorismate synthase
VGGVVEVVVRNVPAGLGAPVFDKLEAELAKACLSIPACRGFEVRANLSLQQPRPLAIRHSPHTLMLPLLSAVGL